MHYHLCKPGNILISLNFGGPILFKGMINYRLSHIFIKPPQNQFFVCFQIKKNMGFCTNTPTRDGI